MNNDSKKNEILLNAAELLERANERIAFLEGKLESRDMENAKLRLALAAEKRYERSRLLATEMLRKSMISSQDLDKKTKEIMAYGDEAFDVLENTVKKSMTKAASDEDSAFEDDIQAFNKKASLNTSYDRNSEDILVAVESLTRSMSR